jgi:hypothetical protein
VNTILWVLQIALSLKYASVAYTHGLRRDSDKMQPGTDRLGRAALPLLALVALSALLGSVGLILPAATGVLAWLTSWAAALLALMMLVAIGLHAACRETPKLVIGVVLFALTAFVAYGRWVLAPLCVQGACHHSAAVDNRAPATAFDKRTPGNAVAIGGAANPETRAAAQGAPWQVRAIRSHTAGLTAGTLPANRVPRRSRHSRLLGHLQFLSQSQDFPVLRDIAHVVSIVYVASHAGLVHQHLGRHPAQLE